MTLELNSSTNCNESPNRTFLSRRQFLTLTSITIASLLINNEIEDTHSQSETTRILEDHLIQNINTYRAQLSLEPLSNDWRRNVAPDDTWPPPHKLEELNLSPLNHSLFKY